MSNVIIIGGGAAGMMAAITAARNNNKVTLIEKNEKLGKKLFITGKGRCNFTNAGDEEDIFNSIVTNKKFMYSSLRGFSNYDCMGFFDELGLKFKIERGNRVFPESDHSSDVIGALSRQMKKLGVNVLLNTQVVAVNIEVGPSAPPIIDIAAAALSGNPIRIAIRYAAKIPNCAAAPSRKLAGLAINGPKSVIAPTPKKISDGKILHSSSK